MTTKFSGLKLLGLGALLFLLVVLPFSAQSFAQANPASWTQLSPTGGPPDARTGHSAVYDPATNRMIVFAGNQGNVRLADLWVLSNANGLEATTPTWTQLAPTGAPLQRLEHSAVYDAASNRMVVFGGFDDAGLHDDVWVLSNANGVEATTPTWTQLFPTGGPPSPRFKHSAVYDPATNRMVVFGGGRGSSTGDFNDIWVLSNANGVEATTPTWTQLFPTGGPASLREAHSAVYDPATNRMTVFGGATHQGLANDVWVLSNANGLEGATPTWTELSPTGGPPPARGFHSAVYDTASNRMTVVDGLCCNFGNFLLDVWVLSNANGVGGSPVWTQLFPAGGLTFGIYGQTAIYDATSNRMTMFGGFNGGYFINDVWVLAGANGITNRAPTANAGSDQTVIAGETVTFDGSGSHDPDGTIASYSWDFGDNTTGSGAVATKAYSAAGTYSVVLTVTDNMGASSTDSATVTVLTTGQAIQSLASIVQSFNLQQGITNSLDSKIQNALDAMTAANAGARSDAANKLSAFINSVEAQRGKQLTNAQADALEALARRILAVI